MFLFLEVLSSDEDDIDDYGASIDSFHSKGLASLVNSSRLDVGSDNEDDDLNEETELESYTTPLDEDNCEIDEYVVFKEVFQSMLFMFVLTLLHRNVDSNRDFN